MTDTVLTTLNSKCGNLEALITKISKFVNENTLKVIKLKDYLELISKVQEKLDSLMQEYNQTVTEGDFEQTKGLLTILVG